MTLTKGFVAWSDKPNIVTVEKSVLKIHMIFFNIWVGYLPFAKWNSMEFENIAVFGNHFVDFNGVASTGNYLDLEYCCFVLCVD